jgi:hypothetical protein
MESKYLEKRRQMKRFYILHSVPGVSPRVIIFTPLQGFLNHRLMVAIQIKYGIVN